MIEIKIKRGADQQPQCLVNDPVPSFDGLLLNGGNLTVDAIHLVADLFRFFLGDQRMVLQIVHGVAHYLRRPQTGFVIALDLSPYQNPDTVLNRMMPGFFIVQQKTRGTT